MIYRVVDAVDMQQVADLWDYCFEKRTEPFFAYYFEEYCGRENTVIGGFDGPRLRTMLHVNPYVLRLRGIKQRVPYLVGIATAPEARGQHLLRPLLQATFEQLRAQGVTFVTLMPISAGIYLPYDFAYCYYRHEYKMPLAALAVTDADKELSVERLRLADALAAAAQPGAKAPDVLAAVYDAVTADWGGVPQRDAAQWRKLLSVMVAEGVQCAAVYRGGVAAGYLLYTIADGRFTAHELLAADFAAKNRLLQFVAGHKSEAREFYWLAEPWDKTHLGFGRQEHAGALAPFMMARCLDVRRALAQLPVPQSANSGSVVLRLTDSVLAQENQLLRLDIIAPGRLQVAATAEQEDVIVDVGSFTQLYFGTYSATELWEAGRIKGGDLSKLALLDALLPKERTYNNEYF